MTHKDDLTIEMEKGSDDHNEDQSKEAHETESPTRKSRLLTAVGALVCLGVAVFIFAFPMTYINNSDDSSEVNKVQSYDATVDIPSSNDNNTSDDSSDQRKEGNAAFVSSSSPFKVKLAMFSEDVTRGYTNSSELEEDLRNVARFLLNNVLNRNTGKHGYGSTGLGRPLPNRGPSSGFEGDTDFAAPEAPSAGAPEESKNSVGDDVDDYGSNNQEEGVEEGDMIASDGDHVFAAYGDSVVVWDPRTGDLLTRIEMPPIGDENAQKTKSMFAPDYWWGNKPSIRHLLLQGDRLLVVVEGYGQTFRHTTTRESPVLTDYLSTHVRLYKVVGKDEGFLQLVSEADLNGRFSDARAIDGDVHVVTTTGIDTYTDLIGPFEYYNFNGMSEEEYIAEVKTIAEEKAIPHFVDSLMKELGDAGGLPNLFRISLMQKEPSGTQQEEIAFADGIVNSLAQVHSFDMSSDSKDLEFEKSGAFLPTHWVRVYGAKDALIISGEGWEYDSEEGTSTQSTHLLALALTGPSSAPGAIGTVGGYLLNAHAMDVKGNVLRVATTIREQRFFGPFMEEPMMDTEGMDTEDGDTEDTTEEEPQEESSTQNLIITMDLTASTGTMNELGRLKIGKPDEVITAVRFFDNIAYAVTFLQRDPLYVINLDNPAKPTKVSELDITGFSSYLHSMNDDNSLILAIGQEADERGTALGLKITIFDMTNFSDPKVAQQKVIEKEHDTYSYSDSLWDFMAIRYAAERLIIPMTIESWANKEENFHGFIAYLANETIIEEDCRVSHESPRYDGKNHCYYCGSSLPRRSMIFSGNLMTTEGHFVRSTDLDDCSLKWKLDIENTDANATCCGGGRDDFFPE